MKRFAQFALIATLAVAVGHLSADDANARCRGGRGPIRAAAKAIARPFKAIRDRRHGESHGRHASSCTAGSCAK